MSDKAQNISLYNNKLQPYFIYKLAPDLPLRFENYWGFDTAGEVAGFLWGKSIGKYLIYKYGHLVFVAHLYHDVKELKKCLENFK